MCLSNKVSAGLVIKNVLYCAFIFIIELQEVKNILPNSFYFWTQAAAPFIPA